MDRRVERVDRNPHLVDGVVRQRLHRGVVAQRLDVEVALLDGRVDDARVAAAVGIRSSDVDRAAACVDAGADALVVDIAHGHSDGALEMVRALIPGVVAQINAGVAEKYFIPGDYAQGAQVFERLVTSPIMPEFLTNFCYADMN